MPGADFDPYAVLGLARGATPAEIKTAYRELVAKYHPDRHQGNPLEELAAAKLAEINRAYEILSDPERRAAYDQGQWPWPLGASHAAAPGRIHHKRGPWLALLGLLLLVPLLIRAGVFAVRLLIRAFRVSGEGLGALRGTPAGLLLLGLALALAVLLIVRRRRKPRNR